MTSHSPSLFSLKNMTTQQVLNWAYNRLFPGLLTVTGLAVMWFLGQQAEPVAHDLFLRWAAKPAINSPVRLVLIDDESLGRLRDRFGPLPWPRKSYLAIFQAIHTAHPTLIVFDSHFMSMAEQDDSRFFTALSQFPELISGLVMEETAGQRSSLNTRLPQYYRLNLGVVSVSEDPDGIIRSLKPVFQTRSGLLNGGVFPALSMAAANGYLSQTRPHLGTRGAKNGKPPAEAAEPQPWAIDLEPGQAGSTLKLYPENQPEHGLRLPLNQQGAFGLRWEKILNRGLPEYARSHEAIPLWHFFDDAAPPVDLTGKIALIGASSSFHRDYHQTPMANRHLGPDIHATAIDNILAGQSVRHASPWVNLGILSLLCLGIFFLRLRYHSVSRTLLYTLGSMVIFSWLAFWCLATLGWWIDVVTPQLFMAASFMLASSCRLSLKEKQLAVMEKSLAQLVDPEVFQEIRRLSHVLVPGGQKLEITSMFVDIRNFTALAENLQPHELTEILNEFYGETVNIIFSYHGTIDKFMGDGILIIFGAPLPQENHRLLAMRAAIDLLEATGRLCHRWRDILGIDTEIGITLNSGPAFVGFFGPADKLEYTGVGDTVNICVRLQEHTKQFHTRLIMSEPTLMGLDEALSDTIPTESYIQLGEVHVRGREGSIRIFTLQQALTH